MSGITPPAFSDKVGESDDASNSANAGDGPTGDAEFNALVSYTNDGFEPQSISIAQGETVRFVNNSPRELWVAGDNHPTHTLYPEKSAADCLGTSFDTCHALQAGKFWEFTFNHAGSWGFHNHLRAIDRGTVVVQ
jgi:plastocyanin